MNTGDWTTLVTHGHTNLNSAVSALEKGLPATIILVWGKKCSGFSVFLKNQSQSSWVALSLEYCNSAPTRQCQCEGF